VGKHSKKDEEMTPLQKMLDFDAQQAEIDARVEESKTDYPALEAYEAKRDGK